MPDVKGSMVPEWDRPHSSGPAPPSYASFLMAQRKDEGQPSQSTATRSEVPSTATTDRQPSTTKFARGLEASMWAPHAQQHLAPQQEQQKYSNPTFAVSKPQSATDHSLHDDEMDTDSTMDEMLNNLNITDEEMPDAPPDSTLADEATTTSAPFSFNAPAEQQIDGLNASQWYWDESENFASQQLIGKRRIRSDNSAELPTKIPRFESHLTSTHLNASRAPQVATRNEGRRRKQVRQLQAKILTQNQPATDVSNRGTQNDDGVLQRHVRRVGDRAPAIGRNSIGHKLLEKMGWSEGESLGKDGTGVLKPIEQVVHSGRAGLGLGTFKLAFQVPVTDRLATVKLAAETPTSPPYFSTSFMRISFWRHASSEVRVSLPAQQAQPPLTSGPVHKPAFPGGPQLSQRQNFPANRNICYADNNRTPTVGGVVASPSYGYAFRLLQACRSMRSATVNAPGTRSRQSRAYWRAQRACRGQLSSAVGSTESDLVWQPFFSKISAFVGSFVASQRRKSQPHSWPRPIVPELSSKTDRTDGIPVAVVGAQGRLQPTFKHSCNQKNHSHQLTLKLKLFHYHYHIHIHPLKPSTLPPQVPTSTGSSSSSSSSTSLRTREIPIHLQVSIAPSTASVFLPSASHISNHEYDCFVNENAVKSHIFHFHPLTCIAHTVKILLIDRDHRQDIMAAATPMITKSAAEPKTTKAHLLFNGLHSSKWAPANMSDRDMTITNPACKSQVPENKFDAGNKTTGGPCANKWARTEKPAPEQLAAGLAASKWATTSTPAAKRTTAGMAASKWAPTARPAPEQPTAGLATSKWAPANEPTADRPSAVPAATNRASTREPAAEQLTAGLAASRWATTDKPAPRQPTAGLAASKWALTAKPTLEEPAGDLAASRWAPSAQPAPEQLAADPAPSTPAVLIKAGQEKLTAGLTASKWAPAARLASEQPTASLAASQWAPKDNCAPEQPTGHLAAGNVAATNKPTAEQPTAGLVASKWATTDKSAAREPSPGLAASRWAPAIKHAPRNALKVLTSEERPAAGRKSCAGQIKRQTKHAAARPAEAESALADCGDDEIPAEHSGTRTRARAWAELCFGERKAVLGNKKYARQWIMGQLQAFGMTKTAWIIQLVDEEVDRAERIAGAAEVG
nr:protein sqs1 [Quercus suber]